MKVLRLAAPLALLVLAPPLAACSSGSSAAKDCAPQTVCSASCPIGGSNVTSVVDGCEVTECCVAGDAGTYGGPFACGAALSCDGATQYCSAVSAPHSTTTYACNSIPAACASNVSCGCFATQGLGAGCTASNGDVTVTVLEP